MLKVNLHSHTWRCNHATGTEREYIEAAIAAGYEQFGFSDHTPYPFPKGYYSSFRMKVEQTEDYAATLLALREEYKDQIDLKIGYEAEYYPAYFNDLIRLVTSYPVDFLLLGQHALGNEMDGRFSGYPTEDPEDLKQYVRQVCEAIDTGVFTYVAHPDILNFQGSRKIYEKENAKLIEHAAKCGVPLEINLLGLHDGRHYPSDRFFALCGEIGAEVCIGCDAHHTKNVYRPDAIAAAEDMVKRLNLKLVERPVLKPVKL